MKERISGLSAASRMRFIRRASVFSVAAVFLTVAARAELSPPSGLSAFAATGAARLEWTALPNPPDGDVNYEIEISSWSPSSFTFLTYVLHPGATHQAQNLINGNTYYFRVRTSTGAAPDMVVSDWVTASTAPWVALGAPALTQYSAVVSTDKINWAWTSGANASGHHVIALPSGSDISGPLASDATYWVQSSLTPDASSQVFIRAANGFLFADSEPGLLYTFAAVPSDFRSVLQPGTTQAALAWSGGGNPPTVRYRLERSTYGSGQWFQIAELSGYGATYYLDAGLAEKTTYSYRIRALNSEDVETSVVEISTRTGSVDPQSPSFSTAESWNLDGEIRLTFNAPYDDDPDEPVVSYIIKYATYALAAGGWDLPTSSIVPQNISPAAPGAPQSHVVTGLYPGTTFYFAMKAVDEAGNQSAMSAVRNASARENPPNPPQNISAAALSETNIRVTWSAPSVSGYDDRDKYHFYRGTFPFTLAGQATFYVELATHTYQNDDASGGGDNPIRRETTYYYRLATSDSGSGPAGSGLFSTAIFSALSDITTVWTPDKTAPPAVTTLSALTGNLEGRVNLSWTSPPDNAARPYEGAGENIIGGAFRLRWTTNAGEAFSTTTYNVEIPTTTSPGAPNIYLLTGLSGGATYYVRVWTRDEAHNWSAVSVGATAYAQVDITPPSPVTKMSAVSFWRSAMLAWTAPGDDGYIGALSGRFELRLSSTADISDENAWNAVSGGYPYSVTVNTSAVIPGGNSFHRITGLVNSVTYYAAVRAVDDRGNFSAVSSSRATIMPLNAAPSAFSLFDPPDDIQITQQDMIPPTLRWYASTDADSAHGDTVLYDVYYSTSPGFDVKVTTVVTGLPDTNHTVAAGSLGEDKRYYWKAAVRDLDGAQRFSSATFSLIINVSNSTPTAPSPISPANASRVAVSNPTLSWSASSDSDISDVLSYTVHYATSPTFSNYYSSAGITSTQYVPPPLAENATYWWRIFVTDGQIEVQGDATRYFKVNATPEPPAAFNLSAPAENFRSLSLVANFSWAASVDPDPDEGVAYNLTWSNSPVFSSSITISGLVSTTAQIALSDNLNYYWKVEAVGSDGLKKTSNQSPLYFYVDVVKELPYPFNLTEPEYGVIISTTLRPLFRWQRPIPPDPDPADVVKYHIEITQNPDFVGAQPIPTVTDNFYRPLTNLVDQATYYWRVRAAGYHGSEPDPVDPDYTFSSSTGAFVMSMVNYPPENFALSSPPVGSVVGAKRPVFVWNEAQDQDVGATVTYSVDVSSRADFLTLAFSTSGLKSTTITSSVDLFENRTYWWRVKATDNKGASTLSSASSFQIPILTVPQSVLGIKTSLSSAATFFMILWTPVLHNSDGSFMDDLAGYRIYKSIDFDGLFSAAPHIFLDKSQTSFGDTVSGNFFYKIRSVDTSGVESADSLVFRTFAGDAAYAESPDRVFVMEIPSEVARSLGAAHNEYGTDLMVKISTKSTDAALSEFEVAILRPDGAKLDKYTFAAAVKLKFSIAGISRAAARREASARAVELSPSDVAIFWYNGVEFLKFPSAVASSSGEVVSHIANAGTYQVRRSLRSSAAAVTAVNPPKVFTPGIEPYEKIQFFVDNPFAENVSGEIINLRGTKVASLVAVGDNKEISVTLEWNGRDAGGVYAQKGVYIYQITIGAEVRNGAVIAAR